MTFLTYMFRFTRYHKNIKDEYIKRHNNFVIECTFTRANSLKKTVITLVNKKRY